MIKNRLSTCLSYVKGFNVLYDIGTDHAYAPIKALESGYIKKAYAVDNKIGPLTLAKENIVKHGLNDHIKPILSNGIDAITPEVDVILMAGLGGNIIYETFKDANLVHIKRLVLQPNNNPARVRALTKNNYIIVDETMVQEGREIYTIIVLEPGQKNYTEKDITFGPILMAKKSTLYKTWLDNELNHLQAIIQKIPKDKLKSSLLKKEAALKEVIYEWSNH